MKIPNGRERSALRNLRFSEWEDAAKLHTGKITTDSLLANGWIEVYQGSFIGGQIRYCITELGKAAYDAPIPKTQRGDPRLKTAPSRLQEAKPRLRKLK